MKLKKPKGLFKNLFLLAVSATTTLALIEIIFRLLGYGNLEVYEPDSQLFWRLKPNQNCATKIGLKPVRINSHGTRGREFQIPKPTRIYRVLCLGDSRTFGWGLAEEETYCSILEDSLRSRWHHSVNVEVINAGVNAWSYPQMYLYLLERSLTYEPSLIILGEANLWNDFCEDADEQFRRDFMLRIRLKNLLRRSALYHYLVEVQLKEYYDRYRSHLIPKVARPDEVSFAAVVNKDSVLTLQMRPLFELSRERRIPLVILHIPDQRDLGGTTRVGGEVLNVKRRLCREYSVPLVDLSKSFSATKAEIYQEADPVHPNVSGNALIANELCQSIAIGDFQDMNR